MSVNTELKELETCNESQGCGVVESARSYRTFIPRADIYEKDNDIIVLADMPGVDESTVDITIEKNILNIRGGVNIDVPQGYSLTHAEYAVGDYQRIFTLSDEIDRENISATVKNGVLKLILPKSASAKARKISVTPG